MLQNAYFLAKIGADTAENEQHFAEILTIRCQWRTASRPAYCRDANLADTSRGAHVVIELTEGGKDTSE